MCQISNSSSDPTSFFSDLFRLCELSQLIYCGVDGNNRANGGYTFLFNSSSVAKEAADALRGEWDGMNSVTISQCEVVSIREGDYIVVGNGVDSVKFELGEREIEY